VPVAVVSDASPLRAIAHLGLLNQLPQLFDQVFVPPAVVDELSVPLPGIVPIDFTAAPFLKIRAPGNRAEVGRLEMSLGAGESEAIALAIEIEPDYLLIDESTGRKLAARMGLKPMGVLGILAEFKRRGVIDLIAPLIEQLRSELKFRLSPALLREVLESLGE
jgi:predicted nucleic acid-binding protein